MVDEHDFKAFPELTNSQMGAHYLDSPHKQIFRDFECNVKKVHDGDTITVDWSERDFNFPIRLARINAPELNEEGGKEAHSWLEQQLLNEDITIQIDPKNRVEKWGRLLGTVFHTGMDIGQEMLHNGFAKPFDERNEGKIINPIKEEAF